MKQPRIRISTDHVCDSYQERKGRIREKIEGNAWNDCEGHGGARLSAGLIAISLHRCLPRTTGPEKPPMSSNTNNCVVNSSVESKHPGLTKHPDLRMSTSSAY
jgi:hypothetical protein